MKFDIKEEEIIFDDYFKIKKGIVQWESFDGKPIEAKRFAFERGDSVAALVYNRTNNTLLFANQFRYPTCKHQLGWILEIVAGSLNEDENPEEAIKREILEEIGFAVKKTELISVFYTSPGGSTERIFLYYTEVSESDRQDRGGGVKDEKEDIQLIEIPSIKIKEKLSSFQDAKTILAVQWFILNKLNL